MKLTLALATVAPLAAFGATITLFEGPFPTTTKLPLLSFPSVSPTLHAIGTGADGMTTYLEEYAISVVVELDPIQTGSDGLFNPSTTFRTSTSINTITPTTVSYTFGEDATHYVFHYDAEPSGDFPGRIGQDNDCVFDGKSSATCVDRVWIGSDTMTTTFSGSANTFHTTIAAETKDSSAVPGARYMKESCLSWGIFAMISVLSAWLLLL